MEPSFVIVMGVSGAGKTTLAKGIAAAMDWPYAEGDEFHPAANVAKMAAGEPLTDEDRWPWLQAIATWLRAQNRDAVLTCSALRRPYREVLRASRAGVRFVHADVPAAELERRLADRRGHYMPASLLTSQLDALEPLAADEPGVVVNASGSPQEALQIALAALELTPARSLPLDPAALEAVRSVTPRG